MTLPPTLSDLPTRAQISVLKTTIQMQMKALYTTLSQLAEVSPGEFELSIDAPLLRGLGRIQSVKVKISRAKKDKL